MCACVLIKDGNSSAIHGIFTRKMDRLTTVMPVFGKALEHWSDITGPHHGCWCKSWSKQKDSDLHIICNPHLSWSVHYIVYWCKDLQIGESCCPFYLVFWCFFFHQRWAGLPVIRLVMVHPYHILQTSCAIRHVHIQVSTRIYIQGESPPSYVCWFINPRTN